MYTIKHKNGHYEIYKDSEWISNEDTKHDAEKEIDRLENKEPDLDYN